MNNKNGLRPIYIILIAILAFATIAIIIASSLYASHFHGGLSSKQGTWGEFGDFFGGTLNPIFSFLTILALLLTIILQIDELKQTRAAAESSAAALNSQLKISENQAREQSFFRFLNDIRNDKIITTHIAKNKALICALYCCIYEKGIEEAERDISRSEINSYLKLVSYPGSIYQTLIAKVATISNIINQFEESEKDKYSQLVRAYLTSTLVAFIYNLSSITSKDKFEAIRKTRMIDGSRFDLYLTTKLFEETDTKLENFIKKRESLVTSLKEWAEPEMTAFSNRLKRKTSNK